MDRDSEPDCSRKRSASPPGSTSSDDGEDLARLEELTRMRARLESRIRAKQLKKLTRPMNDREDTLHNPFHTVETRAPDGASDGSSVPAPHTPRRTRTTLATLPFSSPEGDVNTTPPAIASSARTEDVTPPTKRTPLVSPGFRTPSPPPRTRHFMSPPSGASSRKRHHSPSPLPRRPAAPIFRTQQGSLTPTRAPVQQPRALTEARITTPEPNKDTRDGRKALGIDARSFNDELDDELDYLMEDDLDDDFFDSILDTDLDELDRLSPEQPKAEDTEASAIAEISKVSRPQVEPAKDTHAAEKAVTESKAPLTLTDTVIAQREDLEATLAAQARPRPTFYSIASGKRSLSTHEITAIGHTLEFDPLSGLRIRDRALPCEALANMTHDLRLIPIADGDSIRENMAQRPMTGVLSDPSSRGRLGQGQSAAKDVKEAASSSRNWIIAGVVGAISKQRTTAKKDKYCLFQLCDLRKSAINVFMFRKVMDEYHGKLRVGDLVVLLEPKVLNQAERSGTVGVEVVHPDCMLIIGVARDFGLCEAVKKNGQDCGKIMDRRGSAYCTYHIMLVSNKQRNQRGSLLVGTSSIYDMEKPQSQPRAGLVPRYARGAYNSSNPQSAARRLMGDTAKETTYLFENGGVVSSAMMDAKGTKASRTDQPDDDLSSFLMNQNNPGGQYLRQAKASKDVTWAKDITSPKTPTKSSELFPSEMIRRMGYDPVTGQFVHGSPKRMNDDPEARERSIRLLAERVKSPPGPISPLSDMLASGRRRTIDIKGTTRVIAQPRTTNRTTGNANNGRQVNGDVFFGGKGRNTVKSVSGAPGGSKWVDIMGSSDDSGGDSDEGLLSLRQQRAKNLQEKAALSSPASRAVAPVQPPPPAPGPASDAPRGPPSAKDVLANRTRQISKQTPTPAASASTSSLAPSTPDTLPHPPHSPHSPHSPIPAAPSASVDQSPAIHVDKKQKFVDLSDSE
ncbi:hypothetical protein KVV02_007432 [Mortierella alpina]|uniref:Zinc finger Mcm10/DnaG-type domain-containing protein n=1 Tax=Mortierella alpina TaxID=64518 RepID=A0A9P8CX80_MORAP|nr:hypothetical protein KVV02_007432 [Mortierella alpina]